MTTGRGVRGAAVVREPDLSPKPMEIEEIEEAKKKVKKGRRGRLSTILASRLMSQRGGILKKDLGE